ncbi:AraC family transcriptional regulator [Veronia pacifica]|uniref:AraC family transcriptional regulator n=1 Tax=Veronia pacifica TaxID=1080227 RepID=A0A1C3ESI3_9GAMM|nr:helix-turn-helix transcriptional regulator [Veronia pacifica]ODA36133.1 AraC family transcriptional regulator [Veronia pacifica]
MKHLYTPLYEWEQPPADIFFGHGEFLSGTFTRDHSHSWGQLQLIRGGIMEVKVGDKRYLSPSQFAIWVPPHISHTSYMRRSVSYCSMNIAVSKATVMPSHPCLFEVSALISAIVDELKVQKLTVPETDEEKRLAAVMFDQVIAAKQHSGFLPTSGDPLIRPIIDALEEDPTNERSLATWAKELHTSERTLARHCVSELGMNFTEWRSRIKFVHSLSLLRKGKSVKEVALSLGYNQSSPFITMFKKHANCTPEQYRKQNALFD